MAPGVETKKKKKPFYKTLWIQVLIGMGVGVLLGHFYPSTGASLQPLGDAFINLIKMIIGPIIFVTVVSGLSKMSNMKEVGRIGVRAIVLFELASTVALLLGLAVVVLYQPGVGINADPAALKSGIVPGASTTIPGGVGFFMAMIPSTPSAAFASGNILQIMVFSILFGLALLRIGEKGRTILNLIETVSAALFSALALIMNLAPIGVFGAMAFTVGKFGIYTLIPMGKVVGAVYFTCIVFVLLILGPAARLAGFSILKYLAYIKDEILIVLATSTSEVVLPRLIKKLEDVGCKESVVGLVVPTGYSFNQDGSAIYQSISLLFIAQAMNLPLTWTEIITFLLVLKVTSKAGAGVSGSAFVVLAATLATVPTVPVAGMALLIGIERFMSMARGTTNMICNGVVTMIVAKWDGALDVARMNQVLDGRPVAGQAVTEAAE